MWYSRVILSKGIWSVQGWIFRNWYNAVVVSWRMMQCDSKVHCCWGESIFHWFIKVSWYEPAFIRFIRTENVKDDYRYSIYASHEHVNSVPFPWASQSDVCSRTAIFTTRNILANRRIAYFTSTSRSTTTRATTLRSRTECYLRPFPARESQMNGKLKATSMLGSFS